MRRATVAVIAAAGLVVTAASGGFAGEPQGAVGGSACLIGAPPAGSVMPAPFLKLPFREQDAKGSLYDTEG